eukprot:scpid23166/ scgid19012/ 
MLMGRVQRVLDTSNAEKCVLVSFHGLCSSFRLYQTPKWIAPGEATCTSTRVQCYSGSQLETKGLLAAILAKFSLAFSWLQLPCFPWYTWSQQDKSMAVQCVQLSCCCETGDLLESSSCSVHTASL